MKVADLRDALKSALSELQEYDEMEGLLASEAGDGGDEEPAGGVGAMLQLILREVRAIRGERAEVSKLRQECQELRSVVAQQQAFMEQLDARDRQCNVVLTGVPEEDAADLDGATSDAEKCDMVLSKMGVQGVQQLEVSRLGKPADGRNRPILLRVASRIERDRVLADTKALKEAGPAYKGIYVKKDTHPATRKEWKRLRDAEKYEKQKAENQGCIIELDTKSRELRRDGVVIDRWCPTYFP